MTAFGNLVKTATVMQPLFMGILVSALIGIALTLPISSAAICIMLSLDGLAGGAATAGCCAQMVGFAVLSFCENKWGGLLAQGLGTSMLQMGNIVRNPKIWIPPTLASMVTLSALHDGLPSGKYSSRFRHGNLRSRRIDRHLHRHAGSGNSMMWPGILLICFVLPAVLTLFFGALCRKAGWIKEGDLKLDL